MDLLLYQHGHGFGIWAGHRPISGNHQHYGENGDSHQQYGQPDCQFFSTSLHRGDACNRHHSETIETPFTAIGTFGDGSTQNLTQSVQWTAAPASVATISNVGGSIGVATGVSVGTATITAIFGGQIGTASLNVTNATLSSITITPNNPHISAGGSEQFVATGNFSDGSTQNITDQAIWTSSNVNVAVINATGLANSASTGTTTIKAALNGVNDTTVLTVQ